LTSSPANTNQKVGTITVSNNAAGANAGPLTLTAAPTATRFSGNANATFAVTGGTCGAGTVLNPGGPGAAGSTCTIQVTLTYTAGAVAPFGATGRVTVTDSGTAGTVQNYNFAAN